MAVVQKFIRSIAGRQSGAISGHPGQSGAIVLLLAAAIAPSSSAYAATKKPPAAAAKPAAKPIPKPVHRIAASGVLLEVDLAAIAKLKATAPDDKFSDDPTLAYVGRPFSVTLKGMGLNVDYDREKQVLRVVLNRFSNTFIFDRDLTSSTYVGQNGFGAKNTISKRKGNVYGIWVPEVSRGKGFTAYEANLDGPAAKALSSAIQVRLTGTVAKAKGPYAEDGSAIFKDTSIVDPTVNRPTDIFIEGYYVALAIDKAEWIDGRNGEVIAVTNFERKP